MAQQLDPFDFNMRDFHDDAPTSPGIPPTFTNMDQSTAVSHYNRLDGVKNILHDMRLKLNVELSRKGATLNDELYSSRLGDAIVLCSTLQSLLSWTPFSREES